MNAFKKVYVEITNVCNLSCTFCPGTRRPLRFLSPEEFRAIAEKLRPFTGYLYLHLMGEPLLHPQLAEILQICRELDFQVNLTTNGTLLQAVKPIILTAPALRKIAVSLHSFEANEDGRTLDAYLKDVLSFVKEALEAGVICELRLWNSGGADALNDAITAAVEEQLGVRVGEPLPGRGCKLGERLFLSRADRFDWPDAERKDSEEHLFCYGLRDQFGVLCDGGVVPCCLDSDGTILLGNLLTEPLEEILSSPRALAMREGFSRRRAVEPLCRGCGYARRL